MIKTSKSQLEAKARYQKNSVRWTASAKKGSQRAELLEIAKTDEKFVTKFWEWLEKNY